MTWVEFVVTYAVCWWLVLFMVLPHQASAPEAPALGHAPSAPAKPQLRRKIRWTTLLAILPAIGMYFVVEVAHGAETVYRAGSGCNPLPATTTGDVNARDGTGTGDKKVKSANLESKTILGDKDSYAIPLWIPSAGYVDPAGTPSGRNVDLSNSFIQAGELAVKTDGGVTLNGKPIAAQEIYPEGCTEPSADMLSTTRQKPKE